MVSGYIQALLQRTCCLDNYILKCLLINRPVCNIVWFSRNPPSPSPPYLRATMKRLPLERESTSLLLASRRYALPLERPEHIVFLWFKHLSVVIPTRCLLERVSTLFGKPGSCSTKSLQHLCSLFLLRTPSSIWIWIRNISEGLRQWQSLCMMRLALAPNKARKKPFCKHNRGMGKLPPTEVSKIC